MTESRAREATTATKGTILKDFSNYYIAKDYESGEIEIGSMNNEKKIILHGAEEVKFFADQLLNFDRS